MAERKAFLLRLPVDLFDDMQLWARDDLRSLNAQIEYVLRDALRRRGRGKPPADEETPSESMAPPAADGRQGDGDGNADGAEL